jgi:hypothetical protein
LIGTDLHEIPANWPKLADVDPPGDVDWMAVSGTVADAARPLASRAELTRAAVKTSLSGLGGARRIATFALSVRTIYAVTRTSAAAHPAAGRERWSSAFT